MEFPSLSRNFGDDGKKDNDDAIFVEASPKKQNMDRKEKGETPGYGNP